MSIKNIFFIVIGLLSLSLGAIGIFLPVLPTTPFILLSAGCFSVSSPKLADRLMESKYFGSYIKNYRYHTGVPVKAKRKAILFLWAGLFISMLILKSLAMSVMLSVIGILVTIHLYKLKNRS
ncbi:YbaN family protein [Anaerocolumna sp. MB42-C2]|uniref:YbaN family protein n=1 Tax=Anaerocolumna sp. MB42-C2 TaxID=3070997 RepID=UPI0027DF63BF|nr:YbaN family protein [Anaerocolumna sp. MB42-C2]WMJ89878.1 YbaN family protein [Anaerocolumna sp. MB42-C2]